MPSNLNPSRPNTREIHTKDDVPLSQIAEKTQNLINYFNDAEKPFVDLFSERVGQQTFLQDIESDAETWEELSEGEYPGTMTDTDDDFYQMTIRTQEYGKALGLTQKFIERSTSDRLMSKIQAVIKAGKETEERAIHDVIFNGISDGSENLWYDVPDHGRTRSVATIRTFSIARQISLVTLARTRFSTTSSTLLTTCIITAGMVRRSCLARLISSESFETSLRDTTSTFRWQLAFVAPIFAMLRSIRAV